MELFTAISVVGLIASFFVKPSEWPKSQWNYLNRPNKLQLNIIPTNVGFWGFGAFEW
jgi:hypothetical protein